MKSFKKKIETGLTKQLVGKKVVEVRYLSPKETEVFGWHSSPIAIFFEDGTYLVPSRDSEGNNAGALFTNLKEFPTIPPL